MTQDKTVPLGSRSDSGGALDRARAAEQQARARAGGALLLVDARGAGEDGARAVVVDAGAVVVVGRDPDCDLAIGDSSLSRRHARFAGREDGAVVVEDLGSTNSTFVNGVALTARQPHTLAHGDEVRAGVATLTVHLASPGAAPSGAPRRMLVSHERFLAAVDDECVRSRSFARPFTLALVRGPAASLVPKALTVLRPVDRAAVWGSDVVELLLAEASAAAAARIVDALGPQARALATFPVDGANPDELLAHALASLQEPSSSSAAQQQQQQQQQQQHAKRAPPGGIIAQSPAMLALLATVDKVARAAIPVLVVGETGSGKEVIARLLHERSERKGALLPVNCGALPPTLVESTLFGHEKGAFTGAVDAHKGVFEAAHHGTVFLDEIGELPAPAQAALLRVLENKTVTRVGGNSERAVDVRLVCATHRDLDAMVAAGTFRQDLLYRLNAVTLPVPPLRERPEEIGPLAQSFVDEANRRHQRSIAGFTDDALELLVSWRWPGNVRELRNVVERAVVIAAAERIDVDDLPAAMRRPSDVSALPSPAQQSAAAPEASSMSLTEALEQREIELILAALDACGQNVTETARRLQLPKRTLQHRMKLLGIQRRASYAN